MSAPRDIRELMDDPEAYATELRRRWGGLLSYRYIGRAYASMDLGDVDDTVRLRRDMRDESGAVLLSVLGIASPEGGAMNDLESVPNPVVHSCQVFDPGLDVERIEVVSELLHRGQRMGYSRSLIVDADRPERVLALTEGQGVSLATPPAGLEKMPIDPIEVIDGPDLPPLPDVFGVYRDDDGALMLPVLSADVASPDAALHIGPQFVAMEAAARDAAARGVSSRDLQSLSSHVMFVARGKVGPFRVVAEPIIGVGGIVGARVILVDLGFDDRLISSATYQFRMVPAAALKPKYL